MEPPPQNPFKGLRPYQQSDREKLFGRDRDLILMKDRIFSARTTLLFAGSGVGKTSFLNAKVIPELKKQCVVVWHNRWTGADEADAEQSFTDERKIRLWPPHSLFRDLIGLFRRRRDDKAPDPNQSPPQVEREENAFEQEVRQAIVQNLRSSEAPVRKLSDLFGSYRKSLNADKADSDKQRNDRAVLILDQFEEVFQYHAYEDYFSNFINDLCQIINDDDYQVRVVVSMREEFLGELSIFDNKIADLFNNYYRLKYPDKDEAEDIIRRTCELSGVSPHDANLRNLVDDLSKIEKGGGSFAERATGADQTKTRVIKRNFVAPPYLQIACERLWNQQYDSTDPRNPNLVPFLANYKSGDSANEHEAGGDAQKALRDFCEEKLSPPSLNRSQQNIVAQAFGFLVTKQGAKMAYELRSLAEHMDERVGPLKTALEKLSRDEAKILRESRGPDRSYWFELYHDMYATIVDEWKVRYLKARKRRNLARTLSAVLVGFPLAVLLLAVIFNWIVNPARYERTLQEFQSEISAPNLEQQKGYQEAVAAYLNLKNTSGYGKKAASLWAEILARQAQWYETSNDPSSALLCLLRAATLEADTARSKQYLKDAEILLGTNATNLLATYCDDCDSAILSPDSRTVLTINLNGQPRVFDAVSGEPLDAPFCDFCSGAARVRGLFSSDGKLILIAAAGVAPPDRKTSTDAPPSDQEKGNETKASTDEPPRTSVSLQVFETFPAVDPATGIYARRARTKKIDLQETATTAPSKKPATAGGDSGQVAQDTASTPLVRGFAVVGSKFWFAGTKGRQFYVWDDQGIGHPLALPNAPSGTTIFSADGQYLLITPVVQKPSLWSVGEKAIVPYAVPEFDSATQAIFSPDGRSLLIARRDKTVRLLDLASKTTRVTLPVFTNTIRSLAFSPSGEQFLTRSTNPTNHPATDELQVWETSTAQPLFKTLSLMTALRVRLGPEGKTLLRVDNQRPYIVEKWDFQTGQLLALLRRGVRTPPVLTSDGNAAVILEGRLGRLWGLNSSSADSKIIPAEIETATISEDGRVLAAIDSDAKVEFWNVDNGSTIGPPVGGGSSYSIQISRDGKYAASEDSDFIHVWEVGKPAPLLSLPFNNFTDELNVMELSSDDRLLAIASGPEIKLWNIPSGAAITLTEQHSDDVNDIAINGQRMISGSSDRTIRIWDLSTGRSKALPQPGKVISVAISADGKLGLSGTDNGFMRLWDLEKGSQLDGEIKYDGAISGLAFSSDGHLVAAMTPNWLYLCSLDQAGLHYIRGILVSEQGDTLFGFTKDGQRIRFVNPAGRDRAKISDLDLSTELTTLKGTPADELNAWERKLGLAITEFGKIEKKWPAPQILSANPKEEPKRQGR